MTGVSSEKHFLEPFHKIIDYSWQQLRTYGSTILTDASFFSFYKTQLIIISKTIDLMILSLINLEMSCFPEWLSISQVEINLVIFIKNNSKFILFETQRLQDLGRYKYNFLYLNMILKQSIQGVNICVNIFYLFLK